MKDMGRWQQYGHRVDWSLYGKVYLGLGQEEVPLIQ